MVRMLDDGSEFDIRGVGCLVNEDMVMGRNRMWILGEVFDGRGVKDGVVVVIKGGWMGVFVVGLIGVGIGHEV